MTVKIISVLVCVQFCLGIGYGQDYSKKHIASIHHYAERLLGSRIVDDREDVDIRKGAIYYYKNKNLEGNYVHVAGGYAGEYRFSMWKMDDGNDLVGITHFNCEAFCTYECSFYSFSRSDSSEVSSKVFPLKKMLKHMNKIKSKVLAAAGIDDQDPQFKFILPKDRGMLRVEISMDRNKIEFPILDLSWTGEKFSIQTKYKEIPEL